MLKHESLRRDKAEIRQRILSQSQLPPVGPEQEASFFYQEPQFQIINHSEYFFSWSSNIYLIKNSNKVLAIEPATATDKIGI